MGRSNHIDGNFVMIGTRDLRCDAFRTMSPRAVKAYLYILAKYWESRGTNPVPISCRDLGREIGCGRSAASEVLIELVHRGFLAIERPGSKIEKGFSKDDGASGGRVAYYRMTAQKTTNGQQATNDFRKWRLPKVTSSQADTTSDRPDTTSAIPDVGGGADQHETEKISLDGQVVGGIAPKAPIADDNPRYIHPDKLSTTSETQRSRECALPTRLRPPTFEKRTA
ncbi:MAG: hypothetical protein M9955_20130 [Rhizobiaceae bacterium]|nr:hypothetical protein [Rhizobiaceae bacterium]